MLIEEVLNNSSELNILSLAAFTQSGEVFGSKERLGENNVSNFYVAE